MHHERTMSDRPPAGDDEGARPPLHPRLADDSTGDREARLESVLAEYLQAADAGAAPDQQSFIQRHPEFADDLAEFFVDRAEFERLAAAARPNLPAGEPLDPLAPSSRESQASGHGVSP